MNDLPPLHARNPLPPLPVKRLSRFERLVWRWFGSPVSDRRMKIERVVFPVLILLLIGGSTVATYFAWLLGGASPQHALWAAAGMLSFHVVKTVKREGSK